MGTIKGPLLTTIKLYITSPLHHPHIHNDLFPQLAHMWVEYCPTSSLGKEDIAAVRKVGHHSVEVLPILP